MSSDVTSDSTSDVAPFMDVVYVLYGFLRVTDVSES